MFSKLKDNNRKPSPGMWEYFEKNLNNSIKVNRSLSFYCGDREDDNNFAKSVGV
jgi:histidinol phosphatase-like enzyme